jgi:hypothetical protein
MVQESVYGLQAARLKVRTSGPSTFKSSALRFKIIGVLWSKSGLGGGGCATSSSIESLLSELLRVRESAPMICSSRAFASAVTESLLSNSSGRRFAGDDGIYGASKGDNGSSGGDTGLRAVSYCV